MKISCLIGDPVEHSISPILFREFSKIAKLEYSHIKIKVNKNKPKSLLNTLNAIKILDFVGLNVTLPYKRDVMNHLDELDDTARQIGAVNTIVHKDGYLKGYNTDAYGAIMTIEQNLRPIQQNDHIVVIGAGGAARAVLYEISKKTKHITIFNRGKKRIKQLEEDFNANNIPLDYHLLKQKDILFDEIVNANFIINTTSVGMSPNNQETLLSLSFLKEVNKQAPIKDKLFFDVIFNPVETVFLKNPKEYFGSKTVGGMQMMIYQGIRAFNLWTGIKLKNLDIKQIEDILNQSLNERD